MHLQSGIIPIFSLAITAILPGLSAAHVVPRSKDNHGKPYHDPQPSLLPASSGERWESKSRPYWLNPHWLGWCYSLCQQKAYRSPLGFKAGLALCRQGCDAGRVPYRSIGLKAPVVTTVTRRDESLDKSDRPEDVDSTSLTISSSSHGQSNIWNFGVDGDYWEEECNDGSEEYCKKYPWVLNGTTCLDFCREFCKSFRGRGEDEDLDLFTVPDFENNMDLCNAWSNEYCEEYPWVLNGTSCHDVGRGWCNQTRTALRGEEHRFPSWPPPFVWPIVPVEDANEDGDQEIINETSVVNLGANMQETTRQIDPDSLKFGAAICDYVCHSQEKLSGDLPENEAAQCSLGCERVCRFLSGEDEGGYQETFHVEDIDSMSDPSPSASKKQMARPIDPDDTEALVIICSIVCGLQHKFVAGHSEHEAEQCLNSCARVCQDLRVSEEPPEGLELPEEDSEDEDSPI